MKLRYLYGKHSDNNNSSQKNQGWRSSRVDLHYTFHPCMNYFTGKTNTTKSKHVVEGFRGKRGNTCTTTTSNITAIIKDFFLFK